MPLFVYEKVVGCIPRSFIRMSSSHLRSSASPTSNGGSLNCETCQVEVWCTVIDGDDAVLTILQHFLVYLESGGPSRRAVSTDWARFACEVTPNGEEAQVALLQFGAVMKAFAANIRSRKRGTVPSEADTLLDPSLN